MPQKAVAFHRPSVTTKIQIKFPQGVASAAAYSDSVPRSLPGKTVVLPEKSFEKFSAENGLNLF